MIRPLLLSLLAVLMTLVACSPPAQPATTVPTITSKSEPTETVEPSSSPTPSITPVPITRICTPLQDHAFEELTKYVTQPFAAPLGANRETGHHGVDIAYYRRSGSGPHIEGTLIQSVLNGKVAGLGYNPVYGNYLILETPAQFLPVAVISLFSIESDQSIYLLYAHMMDLAPLDLGESIDCTGVIGAVGDSGDQFFVSDPHLHFEIRLGPFGIQFAPMSFYDTRATEEEKAEYLFWRTDEIFTLKDPMLLMNLAAE